MKKKNRRKLKEFFPKTLDTMVKQCIYKRERKK